MDAICVMFLLCLPPRSIFVSVVFDFNASLNSFTSLSLISLPVDEKSTNTWNHFVSNNAIHGTMRFLTPQIHCSAWKDVHQNTNSLKRAFPYDFLCHQDNNKVWLNNFSMGTRQTTQVYAISPFSGWPGSLQHVWIYGGCQSPQLWGGGGLILVRHPIWNHRNHITMTFNRSWPPPIMKWVAHHATSCDSSFLDDISLSSLFPSSKKCISSSSYFLQISCQPLVSLFPS